MWIGYGAEVQEGYILRIRVGGNHDTLWEGALANPSSGASWINDY